MNNPIRTNVLGSWEYRRVARVCQLDRSLQRSSSSSVVVLNAAVDTDVNLMEQSTSYQSTGNQHKTADLAIMGEIKIEFFGAECVFRMKR